MRQGNGQPQVEVDLAALARGTRRTGAGIAADAIDAGAVVFAGVRRAVVDVGLAECAAKAGGALAGGGDAVGVADTAVLAGGKPAGIVGIDGSLGAGAARTRDCRLAGCTQGSARQTRAPAAGP